MLKFSSKVIMQNKIIFKHYLNRFAKKFNIFGNQKVDKNINTESNDQLQQVKAQLQK